MTCSLAWQAVETPGHTVGFLAELRLHPNQTEWILSRVQRNDCLEYGQDIRTNPYCAHDLFLSQVLPCWWFPVQSKQVSCCKGLVPGPPGATPGW